MSKSLKKRKVITSSPASISLWRSEFKQVLFRLKVQSIDFTHTELRIVK